MGTFCRQFAVIFFAASHPAAILLFAGGRFWEGWGLLTAANLGIWIPTVTPNHQWFGRTVTSFAPRGDEVWLTIDDGPDREDTREVLELLARFGARATFFFIGDRVKECPGEARAVREAGHTVGNHTGRHLAAWFWALPSRLLRREVASGAAALAEACGDEGGDGAIFRPPVGMKNPLLQEVLDAANLVHIGWSARGFDGVFRDPASVLRRIRPRLRPGAIILIHQGRRDRAGRLLAPIVLEGLLRELEERGLRTVIPPEEDWLPRERPADGGSARGSC